MCPKRFTVEEAAERKRARSKAAYVLKRKTRPEQYAADLARHRAWRHANRPAMYAAIARWRERNSETVRAWRRKYAGLPAPTRCCPDNCELCGRPPRGKKTVLVLDHCHETGAFRGWLCNHCNLALGQMGDTPESIARALAYVQGARLPCSRL